MKINSKILKSVCCAALIVFLFGCQELSDQVAQELENEKVIIVYSSPVAPEVPAETADILVPDKTADETAGSRAVVGAGPLVGVNSITFKIATSANAGSTATYIDIKFGSMLFRLYSYTGDYQLGSTHTINFAGHEEWFESWDQDLWDNISFNTAQTDGFIFSNIKIVHSDQVILDNYVPPTSLDYPSHPQISFDAAILSYKYSQLGTSHLIVRTGLAELGKTDGDKYGTTGAWCSEFASWCIRAYGYSTPTGSIGTANMKTYYQNNSRYYTPSQVYSKAFTLGAGDYMAINDESHSVIFAEWVGNPTTFNSATQFRTIEGNSGSAVRIKTRTLGVVDFIGNN